jgi:hypothetical protein
MRSHEALREALFSFSTLAESLAVAPASTGEAAALADAGCATGWSLPRAPF